jgi:amino acid transporter
LGISYNDKETSRVAAILYGAGGGLIVDEVGLLLTFGNYWTGLTYSFLIVFLAFILVLLFLYRYRSTVMEELAEFATSKVSLYLGIFLVALSVAFIIQTDNFLVTLIAVIVAAIAVALVAAFLIRQIKRPAAKFPAEICQLHIYKVSVVSLLIT